MAAGQGFKNFSTGDVLTASDVNGYLMQGVWVFANAAARTSAVTSPQEGNVSFLKDTNSLEIYDGASWVAYGAGDITGVTAGTGISGGGTSGTVTITNSMATAIDAKGDLIAGTGADTFSRLAVGSNDQVLTADSSTATGLKWAAAASGGMTQLLSGSLSGTSTSISTIPTGYVHLFLILRNPQAATVGNSVNMRVNSTSNIYLSSFTLSTSSAALTDANVNLLDTVASTAAENTASIWFYDYATTATSKLIFGQVLNKNGASTYYVRQGMSVARTSSAISSIQIEAASTFSGTYVLYGVK